MTLRRPILCASVLFVAMPAEASRIRNIVIRQVNTSDTTLNRVAVVDDGMASSVTVSVESDAGGEDIALVESDAWLHGAAALAALPKTDAALTLTLYDEGSATLMSFSGTLAADGAVSLTPDVTKDTGTGADCTSRTGCTDPTSEASATTPDVEVLAGGVFAAPGGYDVGLDLAGADTYAVAYAKITVTESTEVTTCDKETGCTTTGSSTTTTAEVGWDDIGAVWEGELTLDHEGFVETKVRAYDDEGKKLSTTKAVLGAPWLDDGEGVNVLAVDEDPLTTVGLMARGYDRTGWSRHCATPWRKYGCAMVVNSSGWSPGDSLPVDARVELTNGGTISIPVNSYQRKKKREEDRITEESDRQKGAEIEIDERPFGGVGGPLSLEALATPVCEGGTCIALVPNGDNSYDLSVSVYGLDAARLPDTADVTVTLVDAAGEALTSESFLVELDDEITVVFANEVGFSADPIGVDLSGKVSLLGTADKKGRQKTLAKGKFYGSLSRDVEGDVNLVGADKDDVVAKGDILIGGEPIDVELSTDDDKDGVLNGPPVTLALGNGSGTRVHCVMDKIDLELEIDVK